MKNQSMTTKTTPRIKRALIVIYSLFINSADELFMYCLQGYSQDCLSKVCVLLRAMTSSITAFVDDSNILVYGSSTRSNYQKLQEVHQVCKR